MALIKCPECSNEVSDQAIACPKCGYPLQQAPQDAELEALIKQELINEGPIHAIKLYRNKKHGAGLLEAKQYVEKIQAKLPPEATAQTKDKPRRQGCLMTVALVVLACLALSVCAAISFNR
jgi:ribosomal protein L7/L12